jgi:hypothetical protein
VLAERSKRWRAWLEPGYAGNCGVLFVVTSHQSRMWRALKRFIGRIAVIGYLDGAG